VRFTGEREGRLQTLLLSWQIITYFLILIAWIAIVPNIIPDRNSDRGIFVSVAERLLAGDILYKEVLDNKEPLFYYFVAAQRLVGAYGEIIGEFVVLSIACYSVYKLGLSVLNKNLSLLTGWIIAPFMLVGEHYVPGYTELPGTALVLLLIYSAMAQRWVFAGALTAILLFLKLPFVPLGLVSLAYFIYRRPLLQTVVYASSGFVAAFACIVGILVGRGEFGPFVATAMNNLDYANSSFLIPATTLLGRSYLHLKLVMDPGCVGSYVFIVIISGSGITRHMNGDPVLRSLSWLALALAITTLMILASTGLWDHHDQIVLIPALIAVVVLVGLLRQWLPKDGDIAVIMLAFIGAFFLAGAPFNYYYIWRVENVRSKIALLDSLPLEAKYMREASAPTTYARLGQNDDGAHAVGLREWKLVCRKFHQYQADDIKLLQETERCISKANVLILSSLFIKDDSSISWNEFVDKADQIIDNQYQCQVVDEIRICKKRTISAETFGR
jgi:hypothetical protein